MPNKLTTSPDHGLLSLYTTLINNKAKGGDRSRCMTALVSMLLAIVIYLETHFPEDGRAMMQEYLKAFYNRIDGIEETEH